MSQQLSFVAKAKYVATILSNNLIEKEDFFDFSLPAENFSEIYLGTVQEAIACIM